MKLFGKKTLALLLALSMVMSVCVFATDGTDTGTGDQTGTGTETVTVTSVTIDKESATIRVGSTLALQKTVVVTPDVADNKAVSWSSSNPSVATVGENGQVTAIAEGTATITATATKDTNVSDSCTITVVKPTFAGNETTTAKTFSVNTPITIVLANLDKSVTVDLVATDDSSADTVKFTIGTSADASTDLYWTSSDYTAGTKGNYTFEAVATTAGASKLSGYNLDGKKVTCTVTVGDYTTVSTLPVDALLEDTDVVDNLDSVVFDHVDDYFNIESSGTTVSFDGENYGSVDSYGDYELDDIDEVKSWPLTDTFYATLTTGAGVKYRVPVELKMYVPDVSVDFSVQGDNLSAVANYLDTLLGIKCNADLETIEFYDVDLEGGTLYVDNSRDEEVDGDVFTTSELADMVYQPNGSGEYSVIEYVAYYDYDDHNDDEDDYIVGRIYLTADPYMMINIEVTEDDIVYLDSEVFEELFLEQDDDYEELSYVTFSFGTGSDTKGWLYYDYDEDDEDGTQVKSSRCYVDPEKDSDIALDDVVFVPGTKMTGGTKTYGFTAKGYKDGSNSLKTETGYMVITFIETADITINAGKEQTVEIDPDLFLEFTDDYDSSNKDVEIVSVAITGAPYQAKKGYLVTDGEELTKSGVKTFYADEDDVDVDKKKYDLFDLYFLGGEKDGTVEATFKVTYLRENSTKKYYADGTIDFVTGAASATNVLNGSTMASQVFSFDNKSTLDAFAALGGNNNEYIVFTSLPVGGKLVYNWGTNNQQDVTVGTAYYVDGYGSQKQLKNVTFVPSYSASKVEKTVTMNIKAYNEKDKAVNGTINIVVKYASYSSKFFDITTSTYADSVDFLANEGITTGMTATTFGPNNNVTRAQFVTFLWRAAGSPSVYGVTNKFTDVKSTGEYAYAYQAILWAVQNNITTGRSATSFAPAANVTHQELLTFLYRYDVNYLKHSGATSSYVNYTDYSSVDSWAQTPVKWADYKGILSGYTIQPKVPGTRATVALWLHRMLTL